MTQFVPIRDRTGKWVFIVPIANLKLTNAVHNEFQIERATFISRDKLYSVRRRFGIPEPISYYRKRLQSEFFELAQTFAVIREQGSIGDSETKCLRIVRDELSILALSQLGYMKRRFGAHPTIAGEITSSSISYAFLNTTDKGNSLISKGIGKSEELELNERWKNYHKRLFFFKLIQILNGKMGVANSWKQDFRRASILIGKSRCSNDIPQSFLWNMIALELLLTKQGDKYVDDLPKRLEAFGLEAFLGWVGFWKYDSFEEKIREIYRKRSAFVHDGNSDNITVSDILFTDDLLMNLLLNLVNHTKMFSSKDKVIEFSKKVEAEHLLGIKPKVRPKSMIYISKSYSDDDLKSV